MSLVTRLEAVAASLNHEAARLLDYHPELSLPAVRALHRAHGDVCRLRDDLVKNEEDQPTPGPDSLW